MSFLRRLRSFFFPTPADMVQKAVGMANELDQALAAQGLKPCAWCLTRTRGELGGTVTSGKGTLVFCSQRCRQAFDAAKGDELVPCAYCGASVVRRTGRCTNCGATLPAATP